MAPPQYLLDEMEAVLLAAEDARLISAPGATRLRENIRSGSLNAQQASVALDAYKQQIAQLQGAAMPSGAARGLSSAGAAAAAAEEEPESRGIGTWIRNAFQPNGESAASGAMAGATTMLPAALPTRTETRHFVRSIRSLQDLTQNAAAEEGSDGEGEAADAGAAAGADTLPYGGDMAAAMRANDREAIKKIMAHRNAAPKPVEESAKPAESTKPKADPKKLPGFIRQMTVRGNHLTFNQVNADGLLPLPPTPNSGNGVGAAAGQGPVAPGLLGADEVAADEVEETQQLPTGNLGPAQSGTFVWFSTPPFAGALSTATLSGCIQARNGWSLKARRGGGA